MEGLDEYLDPSASASTAADLPHPLTWRRVACLSVRTRHRTPHGAGSASHSTATVRGIRRGARGRARCLAATDRSCPAASASQAADVQHRPMRLVRMRGRWPAERAVVPGPGPRRAGGAGEHAWPSVGRDLFGWLDVGSRWVPPTFYHHRFLRPRSSQAVPRRHPRVRRSGPAGERAPAGARRGSPGSGGRRPRGRRRAGGGRRGRRRQSGGACRRSRPSRAGLRPIRTSASSMALRPSAGMTASSRRSMTRRCGRSARIGHCGDRVVRAGAVGPRC